MTNTQSNTRRLSYWTKLLQNTARVEQLTTILFDMMLLDGFESDGELAQDNGDDSRVLLRRRGARRWWEEVGG